MEAPQAVTAAVKVLAAPHIGELAEEQLAQAIKEVKKEHRYDMVAQERLLDMLGAAPIMAEHATDPNEKLEDMMEFWRENLDEDLFRSVSTMSFDMAEKFSDYCLKGTEFIYKSRADGKLFTGRAVLALVTGIGPGCASLGFAASRLGMEKSLVETIVKRRLNPVAFAAKALLIPTSAMANFDQNAPGPPTRPTAVACVRAFALGVELNATKFSKNFLVENVMHSDVYEMDVCKGVSGLI